jgi:hypothetical protein
VGAIVFRVDGVAGIEFSRFVDQDSMTPLDYVYDAEEKLELYEFAQKCPAECWRRTVDVH